MPKTYRQNTLNLSPTVGLVHWPVKWPIKLPVSAVVQRRLFFFLFFFLHNWQLAQHVEKIMGGIAPEQSIGNLAAVKRDSNL